MPMLVMVLTERDAQVSLGPSALQRLGALGVTNLTLLQGDDAAAVVLEGWAFDLSRSASAAAEAVGAPATHVTMLHPLTRMTVAASLDASPSTRERDELRC
jgi:hypothetical protein